MGILEVVGVTHIFACIEKAEHNPLLVASNRTKEISRVRQFLLALPATERQEMANFHWIVIALFFILHFVISGSSFPSLPKKTLSLSPTTKQKSSNSFFDRIIATKKITTTEPTKQILPGYLFGLPSFFFPTVLEWTGGPMSRLVYVVLCIVNEGFAGQFLIDFLCGYFTSLFVSTIYKTFLVHVIKHGFFQFWRKGNDSDEKLKRITNKILKKSDLYNENVSVHVVKNKELKNYAATTSGMDTNVVVVHESYLKKEAELGAVLAHEIGHIKAQDAKRIGVDAATVGGYACALKSAYNLHLGYQKEEGHIKWAMKKLKDTTSFLLLYKRGTMWDALKSEETIPGLPAMLKENYKNQIQSGLYTVFLALPLRYSTATMYAKSREAELVADAHAVKLCGPIPLISVLRPELIDIFTMSAQLFYNMFVVILSYVHVPTSLLMFCVGWSGCLDFSWPLQLLNGSQLRRCFQATGLLKKNDKPLHWFNKALNWILNESTHPAIDERIEAILSRMD